MRQKTLRVFEVDNFENLKKVIGSKYDLIKNHYFLLKKRDKEIEEFLKANNLKYFIENEESKSVKVIKEKIVEVKYKCNFKIYDRIIRSGEEIEFNGHLVFLKRINAGAKIVVRGNVEILDENFGVVICDGEYMLINKNRGRVVFNKEEIGEIDNLTIFKR